MPMSHSFFLSRVKSGLARADFDASKFSGHSFCHGAASLATAIGFNNYKIQLLGRWRNDSYKLYIDNFQACLLSLSSCLHWAVPHGQPYKPPSLLFPSYLAWAWPNPGHTREQTWQQLYCYANHGQKHRWTDTHGVCILCTRSHG